MTGRDEGDRIVHETGDNETSGTVYGPVVQARNIAGGVHFHQARALPPPNQLLPRPRIVGREESITALNAVRDAQKDSPVIALVTGAAGVGKTVLSLAWAHMVRRHYPDGQLYAELREDAQEEPAAPATILGDFLHALGVPADLIPGGIAQRAALYRTITHDRRILVLLDDAMSAAQVRPLLPASPDSCTVVTSRYRLAGLLVRGARSVYVDRLDASASLALLSDALGTERVAQDRETAAKLVELCMRLPLALSVAAARLAARPNWSLGEMVTTLDEEQQRLAALTIGQDVAVRSALDLSYRSLDPPAARLYRLLGLVPGKEFGGDAAAALADIPRVEARYLLGTLTDANLLTDVPGGRYRFHHALVRLHAVQIAGSEESVDVRDAALTRLLGWYLATAAQAERRLRPYRTGLPRDAAPVPAERTDFAGPRDALEWLVLERSNLLAAISAAAEHDRPVVAWQLADAMWPLFLHQGHRADRVDVEEKGLAAARACGDRQAEAKMLNRLGLSLHGLGRYDEAAEKFTRARELWRRFGDRDREAGSLRRLGLVAAARREWEGAISNFLEAFEIYRGLHADRKAALALVDVGDVLIAAERGPDAVTYLEQARDLIAGVDDPYNRARAQIMLGRARAAAGDRATAERDLDTALSAMAELRSPAGQAEALEALGEFAQQMGRREQARDRYQKAIDALGEPETAAHVRLRSRIEALTPPA